MPNFVMNRLYSSPAVLDALRSEHTLVDLEAFSPTPEISRHDHLESRTGALATQVAPQNSAQGANESPMRTTGQENRPVVDREHAMMFSVLDALWRSRDPDLCRFGSVSLSARGIGWVARDCVREPDHLRFLTVWSEPSPVVREISMRFPGEEIRLEYASDDRSDFSGTTAFRDGEIVEMTKGNPEFADDIWQGGDTIRREFAEE